MRSALLIFSLGLTLGACKGGTPPAPSSAAQPFVLALTGRCRGDLILATAPVKFEPVPVRLATRGCKLTAAELSLDMPGMPMDMAPVKLEAAPPDLRGEIVFPMSGDWRLELRLTHADGARETRSYDLRIP